jgi:hypothetical protein
MANDGHVMTASLREHTITLTSKCVDLVGRPLLRPTLPIGLAATEPRATQGRPDPSGRNWSRT